MIRVPGRYAYRSRHNDIFGTRVRKGKRIVDPQEGLLNGPCGVVSVTVGLKGEIMLWLAFTDPGCRELKNTPPPPRILVFPSPNTS